MGSVIIYGITLPNSPPLSIGAFPPEALCQGSLV